jgi:hypothetical protein
MDQIVSELKRNGQSFYPKRGALKGVRTVGHTPKTDHYIYDLVMDFADGGERLAAKLYRTKGAGRASAEAEANNLRHVYGIFQKKKLKGVPRPVGDFTALGAVVTEKLSGLPLQSIVMKAALLPGYTDREVLNRAAKQAGTWLRSFHRATADGLVPFDGAAALGEIEGLCESCRGEGLDDQAIRVIFGGVRSILGRSQKTVSSSVVLNDFTPLNVIVSEQGMGIPGYAHMSMRGNSLHDVAMFLASVEALEKYPFCNRAITTQVQEEFVQAYGAGRQDRALLKVLKMKALLGMFAEGRGGKESALRKKVMWANVMKRFIEQAAQRSLAPAA